MLGKCAAYEACFTEVGCEMPMPPCPTEVAMIGDLDMPRDAGNICEAICPVP